MLFNNYKCVAQKSDVTKVQLLSQLHKYILHCANNILEQENKVVTHTNFSKAKLQL